MRKIKSILKKLSEFRQKAGTYYLLPNDYDIVKKSYTNSSLYEEHLNEMIDDAIKVANENYVGSDFKISSDGIILFKKENGIFSQHTYLSYANIFNYFRLKKENYDDKNFKNYGYFMITSGSVSYSKLPDEFPLILGVSGTLTTLYDYEKKKQ